MSCLAIHCTWIVRPSSVTFPPGHAKSRNDPTSVFGRCYIALKVVLSCSKVVYYLRVGILCWTFILFWLKVITCRKIREWFQFPRVVRSFVHLARGHATHLWQSSWEGLEGSQVMANSFHRCSRSISFFKHFEILLTGQEALEGTSKLPFVSHRTGILVPLSVIKFSSRHFK